MVGTILLDKHNHYVDNEGNLPVRPEGDKELLKAMVRNNIVSYKAFEMLPRSIALEAYGPVVIGYAVSITIQELAEADVLIVHRSPIEIEQGKKFRLDNFKQIGSGNPEIWIKISNND